MKLTINEDRELEFEDVFNSIVINTDAGKFGICQRDCGIVVMHKGLEVYNSEFQECTVLYNQLQKLHKMMQAKFDAADGEDAPYFAGYLKALEDVMELK